MNHTTNYQLSQWSRTDKILMEDFNADNAKIDAALAGLSEAHAVLEAKCGNASIGLISYVGDGKCGAANPTRIIFPRMPAVFIIFGGNIMIGRGGATTVTHTFPITGAGSIVTVKDVTWSGSTISIMDDRNPERQMNYNNVEYHVIAFYAEE